MRKLTTYKRPSLDVIMSHCLTIEELDKYYQKLNTEAKDASDKTKRRWHQHYLQQSALIASGALAARLQLRQEREAKMKAEHEAAQPIPEPVKEEVNEAATT